MNRNFRTIYGRYWALVVAVGITLGFGVAGCADLTPSWTAQTGLAPRVYLGGEALAQKKLRMRRAHADLTHIYLVHERLSRLQKKRDRRQLEDFIRPFMERHVTPLVETRDGEGWNEDLRLLEANLLFAEAALFAAMGDAQDLEAVIAALSDRFEGYESMLIEYPIGTSSTIEHGVADLRTRRKAL